MKKTPKPTVPTTLEEFRALTEAQLNDLWKNRAAAGLDEAQERLLRHLLRERMGFKPVDVHVSICQRCNLPADNCACLNR